MVLGGSLSFNFNFNFNSVYFSAKHILCTRPRALACDGKFVLLHETIELYRMQEDSTIQI